jgi:hypothetical protein
MVGCFKALTRFESGILHYSDYQLLVGGIVICALRLAGVTRVVFWNQHMKALPDRLKGGWFDLQTVAVLLCVTQIFQLPCNINLVLWVVAGRGGE